MTYLLSRDRCPPGCASPRLTGGRLPFCRAGRAGSPVLLAAPGAPGQAVDRPPCRERIGEAERREAHPTGHRALRARRAPFGTRASRRSTAASSACVSPHAATPGRACVPAPEDGAVRRAPRARLLVAIGRGPGPPGCEVTSPARRRRAHSATSASLDDVPGEWTIGI